MWSEGNRRCDERCSTTSEGKKIEGMDWGFGGGGGGVIHWNQGDCETEKR